MGIFVLFLLLLTGGVSSGQGRTFTDGYDDYSPYYYRTREEWKLIRERVFECQGEKDSLRLNTLGRVLPNVICPWWAEDLYCPEVLKGRVLRLGYVGYVLNPLTGLPSLMNSWNDPILPDSALGDVPLDLVVYCRGGEAFDYFLRTDSARMNFLRKVFDGKGGMINRLHGGRRVSGIHFYLPDFSFREKRAFMQFVRSVSMVIDCYCVDGVRPYEGEKCRLIFTFSPQARRELDFLSGVIRLADEVYLAEYDEYGIPYTPVMRYTGANDPTPVLRRVVNQFYLFSFRTEGGVAEEECCSDLGLLSRAEYSEHNWRFYFFVGVGLFLGLLVLAVLYFLYSPFYILANRFRSLIVPVVITLMTESGIVFLYMVEALSGDCLFFDFDDGTHLWLLALPVIFIFLYVVLSLSARRRELP